MLLGPFGAGCERVWIDGRMRIIHSENEYNEPVIPDSVMTLEEFVQVVLLITQTIDRCPSNSAAANFLTYEKQLAFHSIAGVCHDLECDQQLSEEEKDERAKLDRLYGRALCATQAYRASTTDRSGQAFGAKENRRQLAGCRKRRLPRAFLSASSRACNLCSWGGRNP